jgi:hypothetical protein
MAKRARANWSALREALWTRSGGRCEVSGKPLDIDTFDAHHRRNKGMGGTSRPDTDTLPNLLALDPIVHNGGPGSVHADRPRSEAYGWLVPKLSTDALHMRRALLYTGGGWQWCLLAENGERWPVYDYLLASPPLTRPVASP